MYHLIEQKIKLQFREVELKPYKNKYEYSVCPTSLTVHSSYCTRDTVYTKLRLKVSRLGAERYPQTNCVYCGIMETFDHIFFECPQYKDHRINFRNQLLRLEIPVINRRTLLFPETKFALAVRSAVFTSATSTLNNYSAQLTPPFLYVWQTSQ